MKDDLVFEKITDLPSKRIDFAPLSAINYIKVNKEDKTFCLATQKL